MGIDNDDNDADINITSYKASLLVYGERERERDGRAETTKPILRNRGQE